MIDLERLDEALAWMGRRSTFLIRGDTKSGARAIRAVFAAARAYRDLLSEGERVEWCGEHRTVAFNDFEKAQHDRVWGDGMIPKLLVDPTTEEER